MTLLLPALLVSGPLGWLLAVFHCLVAAFLVFIILLQRGKSADLASAFGGGMTAQSSVAAMSPEDLLTKATKWTAALFMVTSLSLALFAQGREGSVVDRVPEPAPPAAAAPADPAALPPAPVLDAVPPPGTAGEAPPAE